MKMLGEWTMKDIINAISMIIAFVVLLVCFWQGVQIDKALIRTLVTFAGSYLIGYAAMRVSIVTMKTHTALKTGQPPTVKAAERQEAHAKA
jgi:prolipoprotein diacylglyceryltransferase